MRKLKSPIIYVFSSQVVEKECKLLYDNAYMWGHR